jgi:hypothetical protein
VFSLAEVSIDWKSQLLVEYSKNKFASKVMDHSAHDGRYKVVDDIIYYKDHIYLVSKYTLQHKIMEVMHNTPLASHLGFFKTYRKVRERFTLKGLKDDLLKHVRECDLSAKQVISNPSERNTTTFSHPIMEMGKYIHGFYHGATKGPRQRLYICCG